MSKTHPVAEDWAADLEAQLRAGDLDSAQLESMNGWSRAQRIVAVRRLRDNLATTGAGMTVVCEPNGHQLPWLYRLVSLDAVKADRSRWLPNRIQDVERRLKTILHVVDAVVDGTDGRTLLGKKARIFQLHIRRAFEDIGLIPDQMP